MVLPPYLRANLDPFVIVIGKLSLALTVRLSPGFPPIVPLIPEIDFINATYLLSFLYYKYNNEL